MLCEAHVVDVGCRNDVFGHGDRLIPEAEVVDAVRTFGHGKEALAVGSLYSHHEEILAVHLDGARVECGIHHDALHEIRVILFREIVAPLQRCVLSCENGIFILGIDTISPLFWGVLTRQKLFMMSA